MNHESQGLRLVKAALFGDTGAAGETLDGVYGAQRLQYLRQTTDMFPCRVTSHELERHLDALHDLEVIFATWGFFPLSEAHLDRLANLKAVFYAAGSVRHFAEPLLDRGITVVSGGAANAVPVAEFALAQVLLANKGYFRNVREYGTGTPYLESFRGRGNFGAQVALLGAGQIGRTLIGLMRPFRLPVIVFDPFLDMAGARGLGVEKVSLEEAFARGNVVSNHLADVPETKGLIRGMHFASLPAGATFINTGRGATVAEDGMASILRSRPDLTALLDVTDPEPLPPDSPLRSLPNVHVSSHIAGAIGDEVGRIAETVIEEFEAWRCGRPLKFEVTPERFATMA